MKIKQHKQHKKKHKEQQCCQKTEFELMHELCCLIDVSSANHVVEEKNTRWRPAAVGFGALMQLEHTKPVAIVAALWPASTIEDMVMF